MTPATLKTSGYLISTVSVLLLGAAAWPGAHKAGLIPALILGMVASVVGMAMRWLSYEVEARAKDKRGEPPT